MRKLPHSPNVLYVDPPWAFTNAKTGGTMRSGSAYQYDTLTTDDLVRVAQRFNHFILGDTALVALWTTTAMKPEAMRVLRAFGVTYKTSLYWIKNYGGARMGMGAWTRGGVEELLIGIRGRVPAPRIQIPSWKILPALTHSRKPRWFRFRVAELARHIPSPRQVELFARHRVDGWAATGLELDGQDIRKVVKLWPIAD